MLEYRSCEQGYQMPKHSTVHFLGQAELETVAYPSRKHTRSTLSIGPVCRAERLLERNRDHAAPWSCAEASTFRLHRRPKPAPSRRIAARTPSLLSGGYSALVWFAVENASAVAGDAQGKGASCYGIFPDSYRTRHGKFNQTLLVTGPPTLDAAPLENGSLYQVLRFSCGLEAVPHW